MGSRMHVGILRHTENISALGGGHCLKPIRKYCLLQTSKIGSRISSLSGLCQFGQSHWSTEHLLSIGRSETRCRMGDWQKSFHSQVSSSRYTMIFRVTTSNVSILTNSIAHSLFNKASANLNQDRINQHRLLVKGTSAWYGDIRMRKCGGNGCAWLSEHRNCKWLLGHTLSCFSNTVPPHAVTS